MVRVCELVARGQAVGVVRAQDADTVGKDLLQKGDGLAKASRGHVRACDGIGTLHMFKI